MATVVSLQELVSGFHESKRRLSEMVELAIPAGSVVKRISTGVIGIVMRHADDCPPDKLPIYVESRNSWWYEVTDLEVITDKKRWPSWVITRRRRQAALRGAETRRLNQAAKS